MQECTDLQKVKEMAINLLKTPPQKGGVLGMVQINHPVFQGFGDKIMIIEDGIQKEVNLFSQDDFQRAVKCYTQIFQKAKNAESVANWIAKPYRLYFTKCIQEYLNAEDFSKILRSSYELSENPNCDALVSRAELLSMFHDADPEFLMDQEESTYLYRLKSPIEVFRGVKLEDDLAKDDKILRNGTSGISWSLSRQKAEWFAQRLSSRGVIFSGTVEKSKVLAYFSRREEDEVIVDSKDISCIRSIILPYKEFAFK